MYTYKVNDRTKYRVDVTDRLFVEYGLPEVNKIVTINTRANLLSEEAIKDTRMQRALNEPLYRFVGDEAKITTYDLNWGNTLRRGAKVKILSYFHLGVSWTTEAKLFALVQVIQY